MSGLSRLAIGFSLSILLASCGGDSDNGNTGSGSGGGGATTFSIGSGSGANFVSGILDASSDQIGGNETATITAIIADDSGNRLTESASVEFTSDCVTTGEATLESPVESSDGIARSTYTPQGCSGNDIITATVTVNGTSSSATVTINVIPAVVLGARVDGIFTEGSLRLGADTISSGGTVVVAADLADLVTGEAVTDFDGTGTVRFDSECVAQALASIDSPVTVEGTTARATYTAQGCNGEDTITASATLNGVESTANATLTVLPPEIGSLRFIGADPEAIGIRGFGLTEVSEITFQVLDVNGRPVNNTEVNFSLNTSVGGISLAQTTGVTDPEGNVIARVRSGFISTSVAVTASVASNLSLSSQSDSLVISTGIADQNSMSLSATFWNPEGYDYDGITTELTVRVSDHFNNPVPDGTAIAFTTEGGQIESQCLTTAGACSVTWTSSNPRPENGRATVLASLIGEESFVDTNGNGVLDDEDTFTDIPEAFRDDTEDGEFNQGIEEFLDFNSNGEYDGADEAYNGVLCCDAAAVEAAAEGDACFGRTPTSAVCSTSRNIHVRASAPIIMARSNLVIESDVSSLNGVGGTTDVAIVSIYGLYPDGSQQVPPEGTVITISATNGSLESNGSFTMPSSTFAGPLNLSVIWKGDTTSSSGNIRIQATTPQGNISGPFFITAND